MARFANILQTIGNTPLVKLNRLAPAGVNVYVKVESFNPMGSVKDRMARAIIEDAEQAGALKPGQTVIEATSGNTGIGLAMVCAQKGYPLVVTMAESFSVERRKLLRFLGAKVVLTPAAEKGSGMLAKAVELARQHGWFLCRQFENQANADVHSRTTAQEILRDFAGETTRLLGHRLRHRRHAQGRGARAQAGAARNARSSRPSRTIRPCSAAASAQPRTPGRRRQRAIPRFRPHLMQGWAPDFVSKLTEDAVDAGLVDEIVPVAGAKRCGCRASWRSQEGIFVGTSSGATLAAALTVARRAPAGHEHRLHAARHRRALSIYPAVRGHRRGDDQRGTGHLALHAARAASTHPRRRRHRRRQPAKPRHRHRSGRRRRASSTHGHEDKPW